MRALKDAYLELYHVKEDDKTSVSVVKDPKTGEVYTCKVLSVYDEQVFAYLKKHEDVHVPKIFEYEEQDGRLTVIEEYLRGETLDYVLQNQKLKKKEKVHILEEICDGLEFLHSAKPLPIIHRDLKPANVMISDDDRVVLIDYDDAKVFTPGKMRDTALIGTPGHAAPEQYGYAQSDERTDIYAVGVMIRDMFPKDFRMKKIADKATQISPRDRYESVTEIKALLRRRLTPAKAAGAEEYLEYFCTNCGAILNDQPGFKYNNGTWRCMDCGQVLFGDEAGDTGGKFNGVIFYCDRCGEILNRQEGFDYYDDSWTCTNCGLLNDISENNIRVEPPRK